MQSSCATGRRRTSPITRWNLNRFSSVRKPAASSVSGDYRGRPAVLDILRGFRELTSNQLVIEPLDVLEGSDHLMSFTHVTANKEDGGRLDVVMADAMRFGSDGRVVEFWTLSNDQKAVDAFIG